MPSFLFLLPLIESFPPLSITGSTSNLCSPSNHLPHRIIAELLRAYLLYFFFSLLKEHKAAQIVSDTIGPKDLPLSKDKGHGFYCFDKLLIMHTKTISSWCIQKQSKNTNWICSLGSQYTDCVLCSVLPLTL